ncbi:MAG: ATP-dependent metallopeptidase FtsH/Yme1/Tma family protein [Bacteroidetes bacterium]|nr:ATP-dependent metallopeptidase FtsH/Yme1/Tma family protein [Bacteroidota bacterium]MBL7103459.1 ATP-dependent zinc metalloprotease FtsH [Bacteroidales bacterium]
MAAEKQKEQEKQEKQQKSKTPVGFPKGKTPNKKFSFYWIYGIIALIFLTYTYTGWNANKVKEIDWGELKQMLSSQDVEKIIVVNREEAEIFIKQDRLHDSKYKQENEKGISGTGPHYTYNIGSYDTFKEDVERAQEGLENPIYIRNEKRHNWSGEILSWILPLLILVVVWIVIMRMMSRGGPGGAHIFNIGKSKAQLYDKETSVSVDFEDVAGLEEAKVEVMEIVDFLKKPEKYTNLGGKIPKGALLVGPPGTGKTLLAKAVAGEAQVPFFSISGSDFVEMFVGVGASRVRDLFKQAKEKAPCIIFIDEIDAIGRARGKNPMTGANDERENTLNQLLTEMDGFLTNTGVIILAATNRADILDRALLRAGRFDRQIHVELPDLEERKAIFNVHSKPLKLDKTVDMVFLAKQTPGFSGADIANVCNESALIAARKDKKKIDKQDFMDAIDRIIGGLEKKNKIISASEKKVIAYHESGHATVSWLTEHANPLVKVTIVPRGKSLGAAWYLPEERQITTYDQMFDELTSALGGRASEKINFGKISTGALNDLEKVTKMAYNMVVYFGLNSKIGNVSFYDSTGQQEFSFHKPYSEKTAQMIDEEVSKIVEKAYQRAVKIIKENKDKVVSLAKLLLEKEVIFGEDLKDIFGPRPFEEERKRFEEAAEEEVKQLKANNNKIKKNRKALPVKKTGKSAALIEDKKTEKVQKKQPEPQEK